MITKLSSEEMTLFEELWQYFETKYFTPQYGNYENIDISNDALLSPMLIFIAVFAAVMIASTVMIFNRRTLGRLVRRCINRGAVGYENAKTAEELGLSKSLACRLFINRYTLSRAVRSVEEDAFYGVDPADAPKLESVIGLENTERIKEPFWRRGKKAQTLTTQSSETESIASHSDEIPVDATQNNLENSKNATQAEDINATQDEPRFRTSYEASLVAKKKYKRKYNTERFYVLEAEAPRLRVRFDKKGTNPLSLIFIAVFVIAASVLIVKILPFILGLFDGVLSSFGNNNIV